MRAMLKWGMLHGKRTRPSVQEESGIIFEIAPWEQCWNNECYTESNPSLCPGGEWNYIWISSWEQCWNEACCSDKDLYLCPGGEWDYIWNCFMRAMLKWGMLRVGFKCCTETNPSLCPGGEWDYIWNCFMRAMLKWGMLLGQGPVPLSRRRVGLYLKLLHESNTEKRNAARTRTRPFVPGGEWNYIWIASWEQCWNEECCLDKDLYL